MKFKKLIATILTALMMATSTNLTQVAIVEAADMQDNAIIISASVEGLVQTNQALDYTLTTRNTAVGVKTLTYKVINTITGEVIKQDTNESKQEKGARPAILKLSAPSETVSSFRVEISGTDILGNTNTETFYYTMNGLTISVAPVSVTVVPASGEVTEGQEIKFTILTSESTVGIRKVTYKVINADTDEIIVEKTEESTQAAGARPARLTITAPTEAVENLKIELTTTDSNGMTYTKSFYYTMDVEKFVKDEEVDYEDFGDLNEELDDLAIDLVSTDEERLFELDDEIKFTAFYYNSEKKAKEDVEIIVEIPDGFEVVKDGGATEKRDELIFKIGTVKPDKVQSVSFTLKADDDDLCEEVTEVLARIEADGDEEDYSTYRLMVFEKGEGASHDSYVTGYTDGTFRPDNYITREEVAAMMARAFGHRSTAGYRKFSDVSESSWASGYITACANSGIITGYTNGTFKPHANITRSELYAMTYRAMDMENSEDEKSLLVPSEYSDDDSWEKDYVSGLTRLNMLKEMDDTDADELATRADVVYLINRVQFREPSSRNSGLFSDVYSHWAAEDIAEATTSHDYERTSSGKESNRY